MTFIAEVEETLTFYRGYMVKEMHTFLRRDGVHARWGHLHFLLNEFMEHPLNNHFLTIVLYMKYINVSVSITQL